MLKYFGLIITFSLFSFSASADKFYVVVGLAKPPYVIQETNSGFEIELVTTVLKLMKKDPDFVYVPFGRSQRMLNSERIDAIITVNESLIDDKNLLSDPYIIYQNIVITKREDEFVLKKVEDLSELSVAAFQTANKILGERFAKAIEGSPHYIEVANQRQQTQLLFDDKIEALVMDINIFKTLSPIAGGQRDLSDVTLHKIFPKNPYRVAFKDLENVKLFNQAFADFIKTQDYVALIEKYELQQ